MKPSKGFLKIIQILEGVTNKPYFDTESIQTIGIGHRLYPTGDSNLIKVIGLERYLAKDYNLTDDDILLLFILDTKPVIEFLNDRLPHITQNQFDATLSFVHNVGLNAFKWSTLLRKIDQNPQDTTIPQEFLRWTKQKELIKRRIIETIIYTGKIDDNIFTQKNLSEKIIIDIKTTCKIYFNANR